MQSHLSSVPTIIALLFLGGYAAGQAPGPVQPRAQIVRSVDDSVTVTLKGNVHPLVANASVSKAVDGDTPMEHMILYLKADPTRQAELEQFIAQQHDPKSPQYHKFLTPQTFGSRFGVAESDIAKVTSWLAGHGFTVEPIPAGNRAIIFSGTAAQVESAFKTEIRHYTVAGANHIANASDPQIPEALAQVVGGVVKLHDFRHRVSTSHLQAVAPPGVANPQFTYGSAHYLAPSDYGTIYDINPLYTAGINGTGESIAILARSNIYLSDMASFRSFAALSANAPQIVITNTDPGIVSGDTVETTLDTEWSGAVAPNATVKVIVSASTISADGIDLSALYAVSNNVAPVISLSYGSCEAFMGSSELAYYNSLWQQAVAQGQSVMVSAGDAGAAGCDGGGDSTGYYGQGINGLCSSPYSTCVGGTEFLDTSNPGEYWLSGNNPAMGSAISYIPEKIWNDSALDGGYDLWAGGGGVSIVYSKPSWQTGPGVPADGTRDVPDISLSASAHDGYLIWLDGELYSVGGTSASAPSFAGLMALVNQKTGARQGNVNTVLYPLASLQASGGTAVFHDTTVGNNTVPGVTGFSATTGYDLGSGLGSVDANLLVNNWTNASNSTTGTLALSASTASVNVIVGQSAQVTVMSTASSTLKSAVTLTVSGAPAGVTATLASATIPSPGSGSDVLKVAAATSTTPGTYTLTVTGTGGGQTATVAISLVIPTPTFTLAASASSVAVTGGNTGKVSLTATPQNGFASAISLSASGLPTGVTAAFSPTSLSAAGGTSILTFTAVKTVSAGSYTVKINAVGGGVTQTSSITLVLTNPANCTLAGNPASAAIVAGKAASLQLTCGSATGTFSGPLALSVSGAPSGVSTTFVPGSLTVGSSTLLMIGSTTVTAAGKYSLSVTATGSNFSGTLSVPLTLSAAPTFGLAASAASVSILAGHSGQVAVSTTPQNGFNSTVSLSVAGLPAGVSAAFSPTTIGGAGGSNNLTLTLAKAVATGSYALTITASGGGVTKTVSVTLVVPVAPSCTLAVAPGSVTLVEGQTTTADVSCSTVTGSFGSSLSLAVSGLPAGVTVQTAALSAGSSSTIKLSAATAAKAGTYILTLTANGSGFSQTQSLTLLIPAPATR
jgi:hypothetical protein